MSTFLSDFELVRAAGAARHHSDPPEQPPLEVVSFPSITTQVVQQTRFSVPSSIPSLSETRKVATFTMANPQMHNLTTLIKRLEAATSRLEDIATFGTHSTDQSGTSSGVAGSTTTTSLITPSSPPTPVAAPPAPVAQQQVPESIKDFDEIINDQVKKFVALSDGIDTLVAEQSKGVERCFREQKRFLLIATKAKKPDPASNIFAELLARMQKEMMGVTELRENSRASPFYNHLSVVSEGIPAVAWVTVDDPSSFVGEMADAAQFFGDRVINQNKDKDKKQVEWVRSFYTILKTLRAYIRKHHIKALNWNPSGVSAQEAMAQVDASLSSLAPAAPSAPTLAGFSSGGAPPPPGPPGPPPMFDGADFTTPSSTPAPAGGINSVFAELNKGEAVTSGLRKVSKDEMTHKNPSLRAGSLVPSRSDSKGSTGSRGKSPAPPRPKPAHMKTKKPAKLELEGSKWIVENQENTTEPLVIEESQTEINQSVLLFKCKNITLRIGGKINALSLNKCEKTNVICDNLVSGIDIIGSDGFAIQVTGKVPTIQIDNCNGGTIYLGKESLGAEIFTSKTSAINVHVPEDENAKDEEMEYAECPVPEQLRHVVTTKGLESSIVEHMG
ncbi:hypothetical protein BJ508DRAFT_411535 [Ascobolus immersus RN42]|uniref:Adenylyl cyclase-associated protein n=1 Tax=Ascobolus immersus RN42 TaxID=1160509 RepID=A0A3N4IIE6_ASCIM|nr:hypothetical protein BJ508DRAFT_411535 [Ascobolus immersus RN42]